MTNENQMINDDQEKDTGVPTANEMAQDSSSSKKLKMMAFIVLGIIVMLVAAGVSVSRMSENSKEEKQREAEEAALAQKKLAESGSVNIDKDKEQMFSELPPPNEGLDTDQDVVVEPVQATTVQPVVEPVAQQPQYQPQYNQYGDSEQAAMPTPQYQPVENAGQQVFTAMTNENIKEESSVLVDVYGAAKALDAKANQESGLANQFKSSKLLAGTVSKASDPTMLLAKGTAIPCVLRTKIDSTYKGFTTCQISKDVYSANGRVLLVERGSTVFGEQNVEIKQGQARVAVLWSKIETPKGVSIDIDSPAAGQLGEMGIGAKVNNHFWKRFGGAIMLSMVKDLSANASTHLAKDGQRNENTTQNTSNAVEEMAAKALENTINIPPTATVNHGKLINILVVRDVDFGGIYELRRQ